jgi:hypothetical protein
MRIALVWLLFTYGVFKLAAMARAGNRGFRRTDVPLRDRLRAGEPFLFLAALLISVPLALLASAYAERSVTGLYENSTACYGQIMALRDVPAFKDHVDSFTVYERVQASQEMAFATARDLKMKPDDVSKALAGKVSVYSARYAALQKQGLRDKMSNQISAARRCLLPPGAAPNA